MAMFRNNRYVRHIRALEVKALLKIGDKTKMLVYFLLFFVCLFFVVVFFLFRAHGFSFLSQNILGDVIKGFVKTLHK